MRVGNPVGRESRGGLSRSGVSRGGVFGTVGYPEGGGYPGVISHPSQVKATAAVITHPTAMLSCF